MSFAAKLLKNFPVFRAVEISELQIADLIIPRYIQAPSVRYTSYNGLRSKEVWKTLHDAIAGIIVGAGRNLGGYIHISIKANLLNFNK